MNNPPTKFAIMRDRRRAQEAKQKDRADAQAKADAMWDLMRNQRRVQEESDALMRDPAFMKLYKS